MHFPLIRFRPNGKSVAGIDQFCGDTDSIAVATDTALKHVPDV